MAARKKGRKKPAARKRSAHKRPYQSSRSMRRCIKILNRTLAMGVQHQFLESNPSARRMRIDDLVRSAVVLSVAAMDSYFTERFCESLVPHLKHSGPGEKMTTLLVDAGLDVGQALQMLGMQRPWRRVRTLVQGHLDKRTTQHFHQIDELFECLGIREFSKNAQSLTRRKTLLRSIEILVERRHQIVHEGDLNDRGNLRMIDRKDIFRRINDLVSFVVAADRLIHRAVQI